MTGIPVNAQQLHSAFELFNQHSNQLEQSYRDLQGRVEILTAQLQAAQSARHTELVAKERLSQRLSLLLETLPGAIVVIDGGGVILEQNSEALALLNEPLSGCAWASIVRREVKEGGSEDGNIQLRDGRWLSLSRRPLKDEPGEILLLADVSKSRQMSVLRQRQERLTAIGEMTAEFAHQVRTPLASAMLYASQLDVDTPARERIALKISERLNDLGRMVNDMLGFAAGGKRAEEIVDIHELFARIRSTLNAQLGGGTRLSMLVNGTSIDRNPPDAENIRFAANENALQGALINLIANADQAGNGAASIEIGAWTDYDNIYFTVSDDGPGIPDDIRHRLFEPFFTTRPQGTGLGLAVVADVAKAHGGDVRVDTLTMGSRFTIRLPISGNALQGGTHD